MLSHCPRNATTTLSKSYSTASPSPKALRTSPQKYRVPPASHALESVGTQKWVFSPRSVTLAAHFPFGVVPQTARSVRL